MGNSVALRMPVIAGVLAVGLFFGGFGVFAALAPLGSAAVAPGLVSPDGSRKTVQHLEGGIVKKILIKDGQRVRAGDILILLDDTAARAEHAELLAMTVTREAKEARLLAEQTSVDAIRFAPNLEDLARRDVTVRLMLASERARFETRRQTLDGAKEVLGRQIAQLRQEIVGLRAEITSQTTQLALIAEEIADVEELLAKGLERRPRLLALRRAQAQIEGARAANWADIARAEQRIGEVELTIANLDRDRAEEVAAELAAERGELAMLRERLSASRDRLGRTAVTAPVDGTVVDLRITTVGAVLDDGDPILDLVPADDELLVDARIAPVDIDVVAPGQSAQVHLLAYSGRSLPRIEGRVREVSADSVSDARTGERYYKGRVEIDPEQLRSLAPDVALTPGMPAEVLIDTGERTLLAYLLDPLTAALRRGLRES